jgi:hypothetical protein
MAQVPPGQGGAKKEETITRVYDVTDLVITIPDHRDDSTIVPPTRIGASRRQANTGGGGGGGGGGGLFGGGGGQGGKAKPENEVSQSDQLMKLIVETVDPTSWREAGGSIGSIRMISGHVVITQTAENQRGIASVLSQLRETSARMVRVRATWALLGDDELKSITRPGGADQAQGSGPLHEIDMDALAKLKNAVRMRGQTTCFNTQTVHVTSGRARTVVTAVGAVVGSGSAAYEPTADLVQLGAALEVTAVLAPDNSAVTLDLSSVVSRWDKPEAGVSLPRAAAATQTSTGERVSGAALDPNYAGPIDRLNMPVQSLATTVHLPMDKAILVGGMTLDPGADDAKQLYLIIEVSGGALSKGK